MTIPKLIHILMIPLLLFACRQPQPPSEQAPAAARAIYETRADHDPDGIGKFYMGREIARVMGYQGAGWLERPERVEEERPDEVVEQMNLAPGTIVADVGAGTGYFTFRFARAIRGGKVYAVDLQPQMLAILEKRKKELKLENVIGVQSTETDVRLPEASIDVVFFADVYHEFSHPREMMESIVRAIKPGGRLVQIEYRGEDPAVPIKPLHKMTVAQCRREMAAVGLAWKETKDFLPQQHFIVFEKPAQR
ncbi:MAG: class I SAM-dependent methyltransferase [Blastocatellia bacterium]